MKKILLLILLTFTLNANAGTISTGDVRFPFIANGGFSGLCDRLGWHWGYDTALLGGFGSYACYNTHYIRRNNITTFIAPETYED